MKHFERDGNLQTVSWEHICAWGLMEDNETSSPLRQHGTYIKRKLSPQMRGTSAIHQTNHPKMLSNCLLCSVYLMAWLNCCCRFQSWVWHGFSIWFTAMLRLNSSLRFLNVNLPALEFIFFRDIPNVIMRYISQKENHRRMPLRHMQSHANKREAHVFPVCVCLNIMCFPCGSSSPSTCSHLLH